MREAISRDPIAVVRQSGQMAGGRQATGRRKMFAKSLAVCLLLCGPFPALALLPDSVQASYDVYKSGMKVAQIDETYTRDKDRYTLTSIATPVGLLAVFKPKKIVVRSSGLIDNRGLHPLLFNHQREQDTGKDSSAELDWGAKQLTLTHQAQRTTIALPDGTQDRLSAMYQFMFLPLHKATTLDFPMTNGAKLDNYHYSVVHNQKLKLPIGELDTMYVYNQAKAGETRTEIWLSTRHNNLPCKMIITDADGDQLIQVLNKFDARP